MPAAGRLCLVMAASNILRLRPAESGDDRKYPRIHDILIPVARWLCSCISVGVHEWWVIAVSNKKRVVQLSSQASERSG